MIGIKPGTEVWGILKDIVDYPGEFDAALLTSKHYPYQPYNGGLFRSAEDWKKNTTLRTQHTKQARAKVSRYLGRLVEADLIEKNVGVRLDPAFLPLWEAKGVEALQSTTSVVNSMGEIVGSRVEAPHPTTVRMVEYLHRAGGIPVALDTFTRDTGGYSAAGNRQGAWTFHYEKLTGEGVICPPRYRWPTPDGSALVRLLEAQG
jgi:hypothetical protein